MNRYLLALIVLLGVSFLVREARGECAAGQTCVPPEDMQVFVKLLQEKKCLQTTQPDLKLDPLTVTEDKDGRIFVSGAEPFPYTIRFKWCDYEVEAKGRLNVIVAKTEPPTWGWRFRLKATPGYLPVTAFTEKDGYAGLDFGLLAEPFFLHWANLNAYVGVRSLGAGVGFDLTRNLGLYAGYAVTWGTWQHNPHLGLSFALW